MHLKSLVLKGFKSFADRSVLALEPGITAIVGPNGSGKSNISDAVLWVLGERNARHLRGQAMEDIIFSGSAARKAVSVAEVDLVLDNSDHTLPVEFDEVVITRRMFRSGESEYLVNGVVSRRLDVLDILHDTGLGTGTHSIISQGSLDSVLQSKPEDRRALIEEAAGVLKHKQRKEKSARKLAAMDTHLARVRDVAGEVARQLGPLERKAKRAKAYEKASGELTGLRIALAVDDLRLLREKWNGACAAEYSISEELEALKAGVMSAEQRVSDLQELIRRESQDAGELARRHRRAANLVERLDGVEMLVRERRRSAIGYEADMQATLDGSAARKQQAESDIEAAKAQLADVEALCADADDKVGELTEKRAAAESERQEAERHSEEIARELRECEQAEAEAKRNLAFLQESLSNGLAHMKIVEARRTELVGDLDRVSAEHGQSVEALSRAQAVLADLTERESTAKSLVVEKFQLREDARQARETAERSMHMLESEIKALERAERTSREGDPALLWLMDNAARFDGVPVSHVVKAKRNLEGIVERLLGDDLTALAIQDAGQAAEIASSIIDGGMSGDAHMVIGSDATRHAATPARAASSGRALVDELTYAPGDAAIIEMLLGDVVLCESREEAFAAHAHDKAGLRYVSPDGCVVWPSGRVVVYGAADEQGEGILARERHLDELRARLEVAAKDFTDAASRSERADSDYREAQAASLKLSQELANAKGAADAAAADEERLSARLASAAREAGDIERQVEMARKSVEELRPDVEACTASIEVHVANRGRLEKQRDAALQRLEPMRMLANDLAEQMSEAKLAAATYSERRSYAQRIVYARERDLAEIEESVGAAKHAIAVKAVAIERGQELLDVIASLFGGLQRRAEILGEAVEASESSTGSAHADAASARDEARAARDAYDVANSRMAQVRVDKSRLEVQVETAVKTVMDLGMPLDHIDEVEVVENRVALEDEVFKLERRIKSMGVINPDAAEEYAQLKERYDYLQSQLDDMDAARQSLRHIVRVIDARMKDDFTRTFDEVNANFNEIFGILFPGGQAHLSLEDPDDVESSGVEVTAQPRGKRITKMMLMSGGEKSLTALALLFAVYKTRTTPFYILDEVEAALDDTNLRRLMSYIDTLRSSTQLIMITHQRRTMEMADVLFGVSMQADGVTKVISQKLERALENAE